VKANNGSSNILSQPTLGEIPTGGGILIGIDAENPPNTE
jgi:hypothetical protein